MLRSYASNRCSLALVALALVFPLFCASVRGEEAGTLQAALDSITAPELQKFVETLADDTFEGREAGSRGGRAAGNYLLEQMEKRGLKPAGTDGGYVQEFGRGYRNLLGIVEGSDEKLKKEIIVVGAHYDHVGYGSRSNSFGPLGLIHNGADDNASGSSGLLELMEAVQKLPRAPKRSILFVYWDGEEKGLLGSRHWTSAPTLPLERVKFCVNVDMIGRYREGKFEVWGTRTGTGIRELVSRQNEATNLKIDFNWELKENSDHYPFFAKQVPIIMPFTGLHDDYHRPIDDANKINSAGMQDVLRLVFRVVYDLAERDTLPTYRAAARYEATRSHERDFEAPYTPATPRLGASWQAVEGEEGFKVTQITRNSAAHQAGLQVGDKVLQFWGRKPTTEIPLSALIWGAPQQTEVVVQRQGEAEPKTLPVNLPGNSMRIGLAWKDHEAEPGVVTLVLVVPGTPGELAGLQVKDRVLEVNGKRFAASEDLLSLLYKEPSPLNVLIERGGRLQIVKIHRPDDLKAKEAKAE